MQRFTSRRGHIKRFQPFGRYLNDYFHATKGARPKPRDYSKIKTILLLPAKPYGKAQRGASSYNSLVTKVTKKLRRLGHARKR